MLRTSSCTSLESLLPIYKFVLSLRRHGQTLGQNCYCPHLAYARRAYVIHEDPRRLASRTKSTIAKLILNRDS